MSGFLPDIVDGQVVEPAAPPKLYTPPKTHGIRKEEERLSELNNLGRKELTEGFSDSPHLNA